MNKIYEIIKKMGTEAIIYNQRGQLSILDQLLLPNQTVYVRIGDVEDGWKAIFQMQVRGAPAIGIVGSLSLVVDLNNQEFDTKSMLNTYLATKLTYLVSARPTAVNMKWCADVLLKLSAELKDCDEVSVAEMKEQIMSMAESFLEKDIEINKKMGMFGANHILERNDKSLRILTHCNTGSLATGGYGTALGVIRTLHNMGRLLHAYCTETRPYNQGSRLTAYELMQDDIPSTLVCDNMCAALMKNWTIDGIFLGADRVVANGDTANKIGTYQLAVLAKYHNVPFYVVAPSSSIDLNMSTGDEIVIEERPATEITHMNGIRVTPKGINCWNPAFDVTPARLITGGIVTEFGVFTPSELNTELSTHLK
ncbi:PREDICTED: methylthioribose-1-phosphate isomerase-like isoform X2 [Priapulus caudatus]|uniref:Methylthioribose-1-phosphate isomerase n=1 Tax=Priapulus caudatus TaxID=37621 RepID=A0ABM1E5Y6_PRICU|nr:PREDICTED: methylthioribose-1-phosphate isomerase-like isoform X2 [Priapulus caudatus]